MNALPRLLFVLQTVPIRPPPAFFKAYKTVCTKFLWGDRRSRISFSKLTQPKQLGGIGLPDLHNYYTAIHLSRILDWNVHSPYKNWVSLEDLFSTLPIASLPWMVPNHFLVAIRQHPLIEPTLHYFRKLCAQTAISSSTGPLTPIKSNPDFPLGISRQFLLDIWSSDQVRIHQFFHNRKLLFALHLADMMVKPPIPPWT